MQRLFNPARKEAIITRFELQQTIPQPLLESFELWTFEKGEYLAREGEKSGSFFLLVEGKLQIGYLHPNGHQAIFAFESPLSALGDIELFDESDEPNNINVKAVEPVTVFATRASKARQLGYDDPIFLRFLLRCLAKKIDFSSLLLSQVSLSVENRLARYLHDRLKAQGSTFHLEKRESLAGLLGTSVRHLNRTLAKMAEQQLISVKTKRVEILDGAKLQELLEKEF